MRKALFIDRDGTIVQEPTDFQLDSFAKLKFVPGVLRWLGRIARETDFELVIVTNQDGLGTDSFPEKEFWPVHELMLSVLAGEGIRFSEVLIDRTFERDNSPTRKPGTGMLTSYIEDPGFDLESSYVIGDRVTDVMLAKNLGARSIFLAGPNFSLEPGGAEPDHVAARWEEIHRILSAPPRRSDRTRTTSETEVTVRLDLDGSGSYKVSTGIPFFDHMLEQLARHGGFDLELEAKGDLHIDEHHTIEDVAITLGEAFNEALGDKRGIGRYGFTLPMDDCLAQVAVDLGGRNWCEWEAEFKREMIGGMPTEMFFHFFKSFSDKALCNLNIKAEGTIEHHKIEAIFKAFAKALKMAAARDGSPGLPTTKGVF